MNSPGAEQHNIGSRRPLWLAIAIGAVGCSALLLQALDFLPLAARALPTTSAPLGEAVTAFFFFGAQTLPIVATVLFLSLVLGSMLASFALYGPARFEPLPRRLHEFAGALPALLLLMLWRLGEPDPSALGFALWLSLLHSVEVARLLTERRQPVSVISLNEKRSWRTLLREASWKLREEIGARGAIVASSVFGLDAGLAFVGMGLTGSPTWGTLVGTAARTHDVSAIATLLSTLAMLAVVASVYQLLRRLSPRPLALRERPQPREWHSIR